MLEIKPIQTKEEQKEICRLCGVEFNPDFLAYSTKENGKIFGICQFRIHGKYAVIYNLENALEIDDLEALILMGKAALNFIDLCGIKDAVIKVENKNLPQILGFKKDNGGVYKLNLEGYFESPCQKNGNKSAELN